MLAGLNAIKRVPVFTPVESYKGKPYVVSSKSIAEIVDVLFEYGEISRGELVLLSGISQSLVTHTINLLSDMCVVRRNKVGSFNYISLSEV